VTLGINKENQKEDENNDPPHTTESSRTEEAAHFATSFYFGFVVLYALLYKPALQRK